VPVKDGEYVIALAVMVNTWKLLWLAYLSASATKGWRFCKK